MKNQSWARVGFLVIFVAFFSISLGAQKGYRDLQVWDPLAQGPVSLDKDWNFVSGEFLSPSDLNSGNLEAPKIKTRPADAARRWNEHLLGYPDLPREGFGTYYLKLRLPSDLPPLALDLPPVASSARIFWNSTELGSVGTPGTSYLTTVELQKGSLLPLPTGGGVVVLAIQIANWSGNSPGLGAPPRLGALSDLLVDRDRATAFSYLIAGVLLIMALYHFMLFMLRRQEFSLLVFAGICLLLGLGVLVSDQMPIHVLFNLKDLWLTTGISYLSFSLLVPLFVILVTSLFPQSVNTLLRLLSAIPSIVYSFFIIVSPAALYARFLGLFQVFSLGIGLAVLAILLIALIQRRDNSLLFLLGMVVVLASTLHDILNINLQWTSISLVPLGTLSFVFILAFVLSRKTSLLVLRSERLSRQFQRANTALLRFLPRESLSFLPRKDITELQVGDTSSHTMTVLCADIQSFSRLQEKMTADSSFKLLNRFLELVGPIVRHNAGFIEKYLGGGFLALFPGRGNDALRAAIEIQKAISFLNDERGDQGYDPILVGMGIHRGPLIIGTIGEAKRMDTTVISGAVGLAARIQSLTRSLGARILVSGATIPSISSVEDFNFRRIGTFQVRRQPNPMEILEFFDADSSAQASKKRATRRDFERAVYLFQSSQDTEAIIALRKHLKLFSEDQAAHYYLGQLESLADKP